MITQDWTAYSYPTPCAASERRRSVTRTGRRDDAQVHVCAGGDAEEECVHTDEVAPEFDVGSLTAVVGSLDRDFLQDLQEKV